MVFVCDEAYSREQFLETEMKLIQALDFDINLPVSYLFLRRYSKVMNFTMPQVMQDNAWSDCNHVNHS